MVIVARLTKCVDVLVLVEEEDVGNFACDAKIKESPLQVPCGPIACYSQIDDANSFRFQFILERSKPMTRFHCFVISS